VRYAPRDSRVAAVAAPSQLGKRTERNPDHREVPTYRETETGPAGPAGSKFLRQLVSRTREGKGNPLVTTYLAHHRCGVPRSTQNVLSWGKRVKVPPVVIRCVNGTELALKTATVATVLEPSG
jgi:hypothetical protein